MSREHGPVGMPGALGCSGDGEWNTRLEAALCHVKSIGTTYKAGECSYEHYAAYVERAIRWIAAAATTDAHHDPMQGTDECYDFIHREPLPR